MRASPSLFRDTGPIKPSVEVIPASASRNLARSSAKVSDLAVIPAASTAALTKYDFVDANEDVLTAETNIELTFTNGEPNYKEGDNL